MSLCIPITDRHDSTGLAKGWVTEYNGRLLVEFIKDEDAPTDIEIGKLFGTLDYEVLEYVDGVGCYQKAKKFIIRGWGKFPCAPPTEVKAESRGDPQYGGPGSNDGLGW